jgi:hypothetical protein
MPLKETQEENYITLNQHTENEVMALIEDVAHSPERDAFAKGLMRRIAIEDLELAKVMYNELAYWIDHESKRL